MLGFSSLSEAPFATLSGDAIRLESSALLDSNFLLDPKLSLIYYPQQTLSIDMDLLSDSYLISNINADLQSQFDLLVDSFVQISNTTDLASSFSIESSAYLKIISDILLGSNIDLSLAPLIKTYVDSELDIIFRVDPILSNTSFVSANLEIITMLQADFSRKNGDIVYYIVYTDKIKPFNLTIARVK